MAIIRDENHESEYLKVHNSTINSHGSLSLEAMGALLYWLAKPAGWQPSVSELARTWGFGREKAQRIMNELKEAGYVKKSHARTIKGRFVTTELHVFESPRSDSEQKELKPTPPNNVVEIVKEKPAVGEADERENKQENGSECRVSRQRQTRPSEIQATINNRSIKITDKVKREGVQRKRFTPPTQQEVESHMLSKGASFEQAHSWAEDMVSYYESNGWMVGRNKMKSWPHAAGRWVKQNLEKESGRSNQGRQRRHTSIIDTFDNPHF